MLKPSVLLAVAITLSLARPSLGEMPMWSSLDAPWTNVANSAQPAAVAPSQAPPVASPSPPPAGPEPRWSGSVFAQGAELERIESTPIHLRPYRPFHVYGNSVRRMHYRGNPIPTWRDLQHSALVLLGMPAD
jgi:hypothetical protein